MFDKISKLFSPSKKTDSKSFVGSHGYYSDWSSALDFIKGPSFDNTYSPIEAISNAFLEIQPYAINEDGEEVDILAVNVLSQPNLRMTGVFFSWLRN